MNPKRILDSAKSHSVRNFFFAVFAVVSGIFISALLLAGIEIAFRIKNGVPPPVDPMLGGRGIFERLTEAPEDSAAPSKGKNKAVIHSEEIPAQGDYKVTANFSGDPILGIWPARQGKYLGFKREGGNVIYNTIYTHDRYRRRLTIQNDVAARKKHAIFTGGSFTYGEGLSDKETLPSQFARVAGSYKVYNYAFSSWGPSQNVLRMEFRQHLGEEVKEKDGIMIYVWISQHINRVVCSYSTWPYSRIFPAFETNNRGGVDYLGFWAFAHPRLDYLYSLLRKSAAYQAIGLDLPILTGSQYRLAAKVLARLRSDYLRDFPQGKFFVLIWPSGDYDEILPALTKEYIPVITMENIERKLGDKAFIRNEGHPSALANKVIGRDLATALRINVSAAQDKK